MSYHIARDGQKRGTFTEEEVLEGLHDGSILPTDELWTEGMDDWQPVSEVIEAEEDEAEVEPPVVEPPKVEIPKAEPEPAPVVVVKEVRPLTPVVDPMPVAAPVAHEPASVAAAQPAVIYRQAPPSVLPGQYGTAGSAIASMVLGLLSLVMCCFTGVPAIISGHMARSKILRSGGAFSGDGLAVTGLVLGYVTTALSMLWLVMLLIGVSVPYAEVFSQGGREITARQKGRELAQELHLFANDNHGKYPESFDKLVTDKVIDKARLDHLQDTELGDWWTGPNGWEYLGKETTDTQDAEKPLLISKAVGRNAKRIVIHQDGSSVVAEVVTQ